jgi:hypothetical protein
MTVKVHRISKSNLSVLSSIYSNLTESNGMTISHYADSLKGSGVTLPFTFEAVEKYVPSIAPIEFCTVIRKKVDLTAIGPNEKIIKDIGEDVGKYKYGDSVPKRPLDLPQGFQEVYKG